MFRSAPERVVLDLLNESRLESIPPGAQIYQEGDACSGIAFVLSGEVRVDTTHQRIANDLGTSREVVSRLLKDMERRGMIGLSRNAIKLLQE
jgi:CRP-like cAMP-binding protein